MREPYLHDVLVGRRRVSGSDVLEHLLEEVGVVAKGVEFQRPPRLLLDAGVFLETKGRLKKGFKWVQFAPKAKHLRLDYSVATKRFGNSLKRYFQANTVGRAWRPNFRSELIAR